MRRISAVLLIGVVVLLAQPSSEAASQGTVRTFNPKLYTLKLLGLDTTGQRKPIPFAVEQPQAPIADPDTTNTLHWAGLPNDPSLPPFPPMQAVLLACGYASDTPPTGTLVYPSKRQESLEGKVQGAGGKNCWQYTINGDINMELGQYTVILNQGRARLEYTWQIDYPTFKMGVWVNSRQQVLLMGFKPREVVNIHLYAKKPDDFGDGENPPLANYIKSERIQTDNNGAALLAFSVAPTAGFTRDDVTYVADGVDLTKSFKTVQGQIICPGSPTPRLRDQGGVFVQGRAIRNVNRNDPNYKDYNALRIGAKNQAIIGTIPPGEPFDVLYGPVCAPNWSWYKVQYKDMVGWMVEGKIINNKPVYWLEPAQ
ncbi:MAG: SH3 domain-containing protein [Anaerolineae bacterium]|nr:SH3 domain-containing protein [Anaerolineae bacterium]